MSAINLKEEIETMAAAAKAASRELADLTSGVKDGALKAMAQAVKENADAIIKENRKDIEYAASKGLSSAMIDRLTLSRDRIEDMASGMMEVAALPDPVGEVTKMWRRPNGLLIGMTRIPIGVIGIIYESRPNVTADAAALCVKAGNAVILRGGSEAIHSNMAIADILSEAGRSAGLPENSIQLVRVREREAVYELLKQDRYLDLIVPRGGEELIRNVASNTRIPVVKHDKGLCHVYVDKDARIDMAVKVSYNAKVQRPGVCNAMETLLVHREIAESFLPVMGKKLQEAGVEIRGCPETLGILPYSIPATEEDWDTEYLDLILSVKVVGGLEEALAHIERHSSRLSEAIITENYSAAQTFLRRVDSAAVYVNASTRFTDGNQFGLGAELGISTQKLHVRGPMGVENLTSVKYIIYGDGQVRE